MSIINFFNPLRSKGANQTVKSKASLDLKAIGKMKGRQVTSSNRNMFRSFIRLLVKTFHFNKLLKNRNPKPNILRGRQLFLSSKAYDSVTMWQRFPFQGDREISTTITKLSKAVASNNIEKAVSYLLHLNQLIKTARKDITKQEDKYLLMARKSKDDPVVHSPQIIDESEATPESSETLNNIRTVALDRVQEVINSAAEVIGPENKIKQILKLREQFKQGTIPQEEYKEKLSKYEQELVAQSFTFAPLGRSKNEMLRKQYTLWQNAITWIRNIVKK